VRAILILTASLWGSEPSSAREPTPHESPVLGAVEQGQDTPPSSLLAPDLHQESRSAPPPKAKRPEAPDAPRLRKRPEGLCGPLTRKQVGWTRRDGILRLSGTVVVGPGQTLTIGPGVEVQMASRDACPDSTNQDGTSLLVMAGGTLLVEGKPSAPVRFLPDSLAKGLSWGGIRLDRTSPKQVRLAWLEISQARTGITFLGGDGEVAHASFLRCGVGVAVLGGGAPAVRHSLFHRSVVSDVVSRRSSPHLWGNLFLEGSTDGIRFDGVGLARLEGNCFFGHRGEAIVRGPAGSGSWKADTLPDRFGNWRRDPVLRGSDTARRLELARRRALDTASWWIPRRPLREPPGTGPWALSAHSPLLDKGPRLCKDMDGTTCDIGLWGGR